MLPYHDLLDAFKNGGGINYDKIDQGFWDGIDQNTTGSANKGLYFYEITPIEYGDTIARTLVGVIFFSLYYLVAQSYRLLLEKYQSRP